MLSISTLARIAALSVLAGVAPAGAATSPDRPDRPDSSLAGAWKLDPARSDDAREKLREARPSGPRGGGGGPRGGMRGGGGRGGGRAGGPGGMGGEWPGGGQGGEWPGRGQGGERPGAGRGGEIRARLDPPATLKIEPADGKVTLRPGDGIAERTLLTDGKKQETETPRGKLETRAHWEGAKLLVESKTPSGAEVKETYEVSPDGKLLTVQVRIEGGRFEKPISLLRVYERPAASGGDAVDATAAGAAATPSAP